MNVFNKQIVIDQVMNVDIVSEAVPLVNTYGYCIQAVYTGVLLGTLKLQVSADPYKYVNANQPPVPTNWSDVADSSFAVSTPGDSMWNVSSSMYNYVRLVYVDASGGTSTAVLNAVINAKGV
jgi:hypothetical protein